MDIVIDNSTQFTTIKILNNLAIFRDKDTFRILYGVFVYINDSLSVCVPYIPYKRKNTKLIQIEKADLKYLGGYIKENEIFDFINFDNKYLIKLLGLPNEKNTVYEINKYLLEKQLIKEINFDDDNESANKYPTLYFNRISESDNKINSCANIITLNIDNFVNLLVDLYKSIKIDYIPYYSTGKSLFKFGEFEQCSQDRPYNINHKIIILISIQKEINLPKHLEIYFDFDNFIKNRNPNKKYKVITDPFSIIEIETIENLIDL